MTAGITGSPPGTAEISLAQDLGPAPGPSPSQRMAARPSRLLRAADSLNPVSLFFGPIFQKEVRSAGRKRWGYIGRALYAAALLGVVGVVFWGLWRNLTFSQSQVQRLQEMQGMAPALAVTILWFQFVMLGLIGPSLTAPAIADEKRARTLSALLTTPLTSAQIIGGKLAGRLVHVVILALLALPVLMAVRVFGGLEASVVLQAVAISLGVAVLGAALGLFYSIGNTRATTASIFGLLTLVLFQGAIPALDGLLYLWFKDKGYAFHLESLAGCAPAALMWLTQSVFTGMEAPRASLTLSSNWVIDLGPMWLVNTCYSLALALMVVGFSVLSLRRAMVREASRGGEGDGAGAARPKTARRTRRSPADPPGTEQPQSGAAAVPRERLSRRERTVGDNPVLWREVRQPTFGSRRRFITAAAVATAGLIFLYYQFGISEEGVQGSLAVVGAIAVMLQSVFMTTGGFVGEREGRTLDVLLTTPLSPAEIARGKLAGALRVQWFIPAVILIHAAISIAAGVARPILLVHLCFIMLGPMLLFSATGLFLSLAFRKSTPASVANLFVGLLFWLVPWLALALIGFVSRNAADLPHRFFERCSGALGTLNPVIMAVTAYEPALRQHRGWARPLPYDMLGFGEVSTETFTATTIAVFVGYAVLAAGVFWLTLASFKRFSGRVS